VSGLIEGAALVAPLVGGFILHGVCIRFGLFRALARPIDGGAKLRGRRLFGDNKTYRGLVCVALGTAIACALFGWPGQSIPEAGARAAGAARAGLWGALLGGAAMIAELPNSLLKRQWAIAPGEQASGLKGAAFHVLDQLDVLVGAWLVLSLLVSITWQRVLGSAIFMYVAHQVITAAGYLLGMRATAR
jgi:hypothetical protein